MTKHIVVVRFFFDWPVDYPFERVVNLKDEEFGPAVKAIDKERAKLQRKRDKQQGIKRPTVKEWNAAALAMPSDRSVPRQEERTTQEAGRRQSPNVFARYPVAMCESKNVADAVCKALQNRVNELKSGALAKTRLDNESMHFAITNPWFSVVAVTDLAPDEMISVRDKLDRLFEPLGQIPTYEEAFLHPYLPEIKRILELSCAVGSVFSGASKVDRPRQAAVLDPTESKQSQFGAEGVPIMITRQMRSDLQNRGYKDAAIDNMKPATAWIILNEPVKTSGDDVPQAASGAKDHAKSSVVP
jgi:hypothetical protein